MQTGDIEEDEPGVFLLINGLLCRTADSSGRFRPSDIFAGVHREAATVAPPAPSTATRSAGELWKDPSPADRQRSIDSDCALFNCFGVLSGGVLIHPTDATVMEFTNTAIYAPSSEDARDAHGNDPDCAPVRQVNERAFRAGEAHRIQPEYPLVLCASEPPLPPTAQQWRSGETLDAHDLTVSGLRGITSRRHAVEAGARNVAAWSQRLAPCSRDAQERDASDAGVRLWEGAEVFRLALRADDDTMTSGGAIDLPQRIPCPLRFRGETVVLGETDHTTESQEQLESLAKDDAVVPPPGVRCAASCFTSYLGFPFLALPVGTPRHTERMPFSSARAVRRLRKRLRTYQEPQTQSDSYGWDADFDAEEVFLVPHAGASPRQIAFALFLLFFNHFGIVRDGVRITGETAATSCRADDGDRSAAAAKRWSLCPPAEYDVQAEVARKRRVTRELFSNPQCTFVDRTRWSTTPRNWDVVAAAWTALFLSSRNALLSRIFVLKSYIHVLHEEKKQQQQSHIGGRDIQLL
ncbi:hypothetical protein NESM_000243400 [Novymonas esmeraldas]|uniref:Uncharacterized protein n=1 Tax=Novymonas esmeraldas TaxID=1808958 RepID=A0AAW0F655_9TRYP